MKTISMLMVSALFLSLVACESEKAGRKSEMAGDERRTPVKTSLYDRLGGKDGITQVVDAFVTRVAGDDRINGFFENTDIPKLKANLVDQICQATGGPCTYGGRSMKETHKGMGITNEAFDALVSDLATTLDKFRVSAHDRDELLAALAPMRADIVERP